MSSHPNNVFGVRLGTNDMGTKTLVFVVSGNEDPQTAAQAIADDADLPMLDWGLVCDYVGRDLYELVTL